MLNDTLKEEIQMAYSRLLEEKSYGPRHCQKVMIAEIARSLGDPDSNQHICVLEAGTGTGKTIAYAIAAIPIARARNKKIVIATATVALQEQIVYQDLPDIRAHSGLDFTFALAKGRRRYLCLARLDTALNDTGSMNHTLSFVDETTGHGAREDGPLFERMLDSLGHGKWDGERDSWPDAVEDATWARISTDHAQCTNRQCSHFDNCYFYRARENIHRVDCIVTNQDLVLADLMMGGGAVLPEPEETLYIFDEGHHLPEKAGHHFSLSLSLYATRGWLLQLPSTLKLARAEVAGIHADQIATMETRVEEVAGVLDEMAARLQQLQQAAEAVDDGWLYRFTEGRVDGGIAKIAAGLASRFEQLGADAERVLPQIERALEEASPSGRDNLEHWMSAMGAAVSRLAAATALWQNYSHEQLTPPFARWLRFTTGGQVEGVEMQLMSHPVSVAEALAGDLWTRSAGAVVTSATLSVGGDFSHFQTRSGIDPDQRFRSLASPFRFEEQGVLHVPSMISDPGTVDAHTREIAELIPGLLADDPGSLVLFTSWRQMRRVYDDMDELFRERVLMQGDLSKLEMLNRHRARVDAGDPSCIFGLASFAEGVDLPGDYCRHVVITKIPFSVPDDPVGATLSEWVEAQGGNAFQEVMLPGAILRMVQAAGRLLRTENDTGQVTVLDRRILSRHYGRLILKALPPFRRDIH